MTGLIPILAPAAYFTQHLHVPRSGDAPRPRKGEVCSRGDDFCPSDSNPHLWVCDFNANTQTQAGVATFGDRVFGVLPDSLEPIYEETPISGLGSEVVRVSRPCIALRLSQVDHIS